MTATTNTWSSRLPAAERPRAASLVLDVCRAKADVRRLEDRLRVARAEVEFVESQLRAMDARMEAQR